MLLSIINAVFCLAFIGFAFLNLDDHDWWLWISIYLVAAICCGFAVFKKYYPVVYMGAMVFYAGYAILLFFQKMELRTGC